MTVAEKKYIRARTHNGATIVQQTNSGNSIGRLWKEMIGILLKDLKNAGIQISFMVHKKKT